MKNAEYECVDKKTEPAGENNLTEQTTESIYKYYFSQDALLKGSYPVENFEGITEYGKLTSVPETSRKVWGELRYRKPLTPEQIMERRAIEKGAKKIECTGRTTRCEYRI